ncbi:hypothetical protein LTR36_008188 [Oleoguttula mirabilis]|uniref:Uncharacterized protein n=1 Tax=Oleoguttula mirabilis TaxID=1507867 RepID=A0AAV9J8S6_9PEZI|nr:hypothetical protein LTR36_008188 [Oleoguttula mirabilis]
MKLPTHITLHLTDTHHNALRSVVESGKEAMHVATRTLVGRSSTTSSASVSTCTSGDKSSICQKPQSPETLAIVLAAVIPICSALVVFVYLHRRHLKKQRIEDANDPHKSLDFGDMSAPSKSNKNKNGVPEMIVTDMEDPTRPGRVRGLSMEDMSNPYLLPAGLQSSDGSIHSMSRAMQDHHDPYRPVTMMRTSIDSSRPRPDNASQYSASTNHSAGGEKANLLRNAQRMSRSNPAHRVDSMSQHTSNSSEELAMRPLHSNNRSMPPSRKTSLGSTDQPLNDIREVKPAPRKQSMPQSLPQPPPPPAPPVQEASRPRSTSTSAPRPPRKSSASAGTGATMASVASETSDYGAGPAMAPPIPTVNEPEYDVDSALIRNGRSSLDHPNASQQLPVKPVPQRLSVMGLRPLPSDLPEDNPEIRANRIRSFYKEYFDESRPNPTAGHYEEDDANYMEGAIFDPETGAFVMAGRPYAQPVARRAMTPPPRGAPRTSGPHARRMSTQSAGRPQMRGRPGPGPPPPMPKKRMPPPKPLQGLPAPSKLGDYDTVLNSPIDYAPPSSYRQRQNGGGPDSPTGVPRPYSPAVKAFTPLAGAYDELKAIPSPHMLRNSSSFTTLDFAPPKMLGARADSGSDSGSIKSTRSGIGAVQQDALRAGAYRVSRIPKEMVTTKDDLASQLRPRMDMGRA